MLSKMKCRNNIPQLLLNTSVLCHDNGVKEVKATLNMEFTSLCNWFVENKLSVHFGEDKAKCIIFRRRKEFIRTQC